VESKRCAAGKVVQRQVLYPGEINDSQQEGWRRVIEAFDEGAQQTTQLALFPADRPLPDHAEGHGVQIRLGAMQLHRPRQWGACWLACQLYEQLALDRFWAARLPDSREGTCWSHILETLVCHRLIDPGSEWRLHRLWFEQSAMGDLLGEDFALVEKNALYRCLDKLVEHKSALFTHLRRRWQDLFGARFDVLLYDLTSTYFESDPPSDDSDKRRHGYSRDKRSDCVQVGHRADRDARRISARLRSSPRQHLRQDDAARLPFEDRGAVRQGPAHLGDGPRHPHRRGAGRNAAIRSARRLSGGNPQGTPQQAGCSGDLSTRSPVFRSLTRPQPPQLRKSG